MKLPHSLNFSHPLYILLFTATATFAINGLLVYKAVSSKRDLVTNDYYQESLQYDDWRAQRENTRKSGLEFALNKVNEQWRVSIKREAIGSTLPAADAAATGEGHTTPAEVIGTPGETPEAKYFQQASLYFYRAGDQNLDHKISLHREGQNLVADYRPLAPGAWRVTLSLQLEKFQLAQDFELML